MSSWVKVATFNRDGFKSPNEQTQHECCDLFRRRAESDNVYELRLRGQRNSRVLLLALTTMQIRNRKSRTFFTSGAFP